MRLLAVLSLSMLVEPALHAQPAAPREELADEVKVAIERGVKYLREKQRPDGGWEIDAIEYAADGGETSLALLALLNCGVPKSDPAITKGLDYLRSVKSPRPRHTYVRALHTMVYAEANLPEDRERLSDNVAWLLQARVYDKGTLTGWAYDRLAPLNEGSVGRTPDNSNTQFAVLALWMAKQAGAAVPDAVWRELRNYYVTTQANSGTYSYRATHEGLDPRRLTMTVAGLAGLIISGLELNESREQFLPSGAARNCGEYDENPNLQKALAYIVSRFAIENPGVNYYHLYGIERAGRLTGQRFFGPYDWYREGCAFLVRLQSRKDGSWPAASELSFADRWPLVNTSFALLFLSKGRTPVLVSKMVHGEWPRREGDNDWNNDRNDLRHLVAFSSKQLFVNLPLAWQNFDVMRAAQPRGRATALTEDDLQHVTAEMLQSPLFYITGHRSPRLRLTSVEKDLLKRYVDQGGFILAEACCGSPEFDQGFKALVAELWPDRDLEKLDDFHPVWTSFHKVAPRPARPLYGVTGNCKTILIYSPSDLSCRWESNRLKDADVLEAFQLGNNIIAYATGLEPPRPKTPTVEVKLARSDPAQIPRGFFKAAQIKIPGEQRPAPRAMRKLMEFVNQNAGIDVVLKTDDRFIGEHGLVDYKFIYMQGRGPFKFEDEALEKLRFNLSSGGLLLADACCGSEKFDKSFRPFVEKQLFPGKSLEPVPTDDLLYSAKLNGKALTRANLRCRQTAGGGMQPTEPMLEGIKQDGRWVLLYSRYDLGCALEGHKSSDCRGYDQASALLLGQSAVLYTLWP
jgi:hypothetical protein